MIIAGHCRVLAARQLGFAEGPVMVAEGWSEAQKRAYVLADNQLALNSAWDVDLLSTEFRGLKEAGFDVGLAGFTGIDALLAGTMKDGKTDPDAAGELPEFPVSRVGDIWELGEHRVRCGSSTDAGAQEFMGSPDLVLTDPPYCSGGFQEAGRAAGSVGRRYNPKHVANDRLSTRGYQSLMKSAVFAINSPFIYVFTDWRMWISLFDMAEAAGAGVRSMIVWNKGTPGMGRGWRSQHEIILWACRAMPPYDKHMGGLGNVVTLKREAHTLHTTQKPVELIETLLEGAPWARHVADPFLGSGSTLIACDKNGRACRGTELDPSYVDVTIKRWQDFTGGVARLESGATFAEMRTERMQEVA
jgi:DNA modification methylase